MKSRNKVKIISLYNYVLTIILLSKTFSSFGQLPNTPKIPAPQNFNPVNLGQPNNNTQQEQINRQNQQRIQESTQQNNNRQQIDQIHQELKNENYTRRTVNYNFPSLKHIPNSTFFYKAYSTLDSMISGSKPLNLKKAVFSIENAYFDNQLSYSKFNSQIKYITDVCKQKIQKEKIDPLNREAVNMVIYQVLCDTVDVQNPKTKVFYKNFPYKYDFNDFQGNEDYTKQFVSKLLKTRSGQCRSMPLLYLIIAEELQIDAFITFSPSHTFVRFQKNNGNWQNVELTNGKLSSDPWVLASGYIKSEALASKIYLDTINKKQHIAYLISDLANEYVVKIGFDDFVLKMLNRSLDIYPNNITGLMRKSDYYTVLFNYIIDQIGRIPLDKLQQNQHAYDVYQKRNEMYDTVDNTGYEEMPKEVYENWLKSIDNEIQKSNR